MIPVASVQNSRRGVARTNYWDLVRQRWLEVALFGACLIYPALLAVGRVRDTLVSSSITLPPSLLVVFVASFLASAWIPASAFRMLLFRVASRSTLSAGSLSSVAPNLSVRC